MNRTDDISNLFSRFGASTDSYHEFESQVDYKEKQSAPLNETSSPRPEINPIPDVAPAPAVESIEAEVEPAQSAPHIVPEPIPYEGLITLTGTVPSAVTETELDLHASDTQEAPLLTHTAQRPEPQDVIESVEVPAMPNAPSETVEDRAEPKAPECQPLPATTSNTAPSQLRNLLADVVQARQAEAQALAEESARQAATRGRPAKCKAHVVAMVSLKGGVGKTTLGAGLASSLRLDNGRTLAIDLDPQNALHYHLGVEQGINGIGSSHTTQPTWNDRLQHGFNDALLLPYGELSEDERLILTNDISEDPHWLARQLDCMSLSESDVVIIDTPTGVTPMLEQALGVADEVIVVTTADAASFITLNEIDRVLGAAHARAAYLHYGYVVNQFDASREFSRDMLQVLKRRLGEQLIAVVAQDNALGEALAYGRNPLSVSEPSTACEDVVRLAEQLKARLKASRAQGIEAQ